MAILLDGTLGITTPGLTNTGTETLVNLTTTGNTTLGDASGDTLTVTGGTTTFTQGTANGVAYLNGSKSLTTGSALVFDGTHLGVGVTPSAWRSINKALQIGTVTSLVNIDATNNSGVDLGSNLYVDSSGTQRYLITGAAATYYRQQAGIHSWSIAASGTAGNAITFTQAMTLDASGNLLVGKTASSASSGTGFEVRNTGFVSVVGTNSTADTYNYYNSTAGAFRFYVTAGGTIFATSTTISAISDERLKENIQDIDTGLDAVMALKPRRFDWKEGKGQDKKNAAGFIAQEFETVFPDSVGTSKAGEDDIEYKNICHEELIPTLVKAIQEQQALITTLTDRITALENK